MHPRAPSDTGMVTCTSHPTGRRRVPHPIVVLVLAVLTLLSIASPVTSLPPTIRSVAGCVSQSTASFACHTSTSITIAGTNFLVNSSTTVNLGPYLCLNVTTLSPVTIRCLVPPVNTSDIERRLDVSVTVNGSTSTVLRNGVQSYGPLTLVSLIGCANTSNVGTVSSPVYRSSGCGPEDRVTLTGSGFGSAVLNANVRVVVQSPSGDAVCGTVTMSMNGSQLSCSLPAVSTPAVWLPVRVTVGSDSVVQAGLVQFTAAPVIASVNGCLAVNSTRTGLCHTTQVVTIRGQQRCSPAATHPPPPSPHLPAPPLTSALLSLCRVACRVSQVPTSRRRCCPSEWGPLRVLRLVSSRRPRSAAHCRPFLLNLRGSG
jgi:hypothetical protein